MNKTKNTIKPSQDKTVEIKTNRGNGCECYYPHDNCLNPDCVCKFHESYKQVKSKLENGEVIEQEKRFLEWVKARDDDWWDEEYDGDKSSRLSIWDFRVMQEFFKEEITNALNQQREQIVGEIRELMIDDFDAREKELDAVPYKGETRAFVVAGEDLIYNYMKRVLTKLEK